VPFVSFSHYGEKCFFVGPTLPNCAIIFSNTRGQTKNAILYIIKKKRVDIIFIVNYHFYRLTIDIYFHFHIYNIIVTELL